MISIILPVHNVEKYVEACIRSLELQDLPRDAYELIAVDDGSTDRSVSIIESLQKEFDNIVLVRQSNAGPGAARNRGLREAAGKYVMFVDPDDRIVERCVGRLMRAAERCGELDFLGFNYRINLNSGLVRMPMFPPATGCVTSGVAFHASYVRGGFYVWRYVFSRAFLFRNALWFVEGITFEDVEIIPRIMSLAQRALYCDLVVYDYFLRPGSQSTVFSERHIFGRIAAAENLFKFLRVREAALSQDGRALVEDVMAECALAAVSSCPPNAKLLKRLSRELQRATFLPLPVRSGGRHRFESEIMNRSLLAFWCYSRVKGIILTLATKVRSAVAVARGPGGMRSLIGRIKGAPL